MCLQDRGIKIDPPQRCWFVIISLEMIRLNLSLVCLCEGWSRAGHVEWSGWFSWATDELERVWAVCQWCVVPASRLTTVWTLYYVVFILYHIVFTLKTFCTTNWRIFEIPQHWDFNHFTLHWWVYFPFRPGKELNIQPLWDVSGCTRHHGVSVNAALRARVTTLHQLLLISTFTDMPCCHVLHWTETVLLHWMTNVCGFCLNTDGDLSAASAMIAIWNIPCFTQMIIPDTKDTRSRKVKAQRGTCRQRKIP